MASKTDKPPLINRSTSKRSLSSNFLNNGCPRSNNLRVRFIWYSIRFRKAAVNLPSNSSVVEYPNRSISSSGMYIRPNVKSLRMSCQKFVSCKAVHTWSERFCLSLSRYPKSQSTMWPTGLAEFLQ